LRQEPTKPNQSLRRPDLTVPGLHEKWLVMTFDEATLKILAVAEEMAGDKQRAVIWFEQQPIPSWGGKTACELVQEGKVDKVLDYLEGVKSGVYA